MENYPEPDYNTGVFVCLLAILTIFFIMMGQNQIKNIHKLSNPKEDTLYITEEQQQQIFPNWQKADSLCGKENRFTDLWCEIAM